MQTAYFAGGCFWCVEAIFQRVDGVKELTNGYCNGSTQNPTYEEVCSGQSGHAEVLKIEFDEQQISFADLQRSLLRLTIQPALTNRALTEVPSIVQQYSILI